MVDRVAQVSKTIKDALEKKPSPQPLRRHHDDDYWDEVVVLAGPVVLHGFIVPRYKTSGLSGDEWRIAARLVVKYDGDPVVEQSFHRMSGLLTHAPGFVYAQRAALDVPNAATLVAKRKGHLLCELKFPRFLDAAMGMYWSLITANECDRDVVWHHLSDAEERAHCQQVGCAELPVNVYRLKKLLYGDHPPETFYPPKYDFEGQFTWYCARHTTRGDCGFEDADKNLELVEGSGLAVPWEGDESPSALAAPIIIEEPKQ